MLRRRHDKPGRTRNPYGSSDLARRAALLTLALLLGAALLGGAPAAVQAQEDPATALALDLNSRRTQPAQEGESVHWWRLEVPEEGLLQVDLQVQGGDASGLEIVDEAHRRVDRDGVRRSSYHLAVAIGAGTYYVRVNLRTPVTYEVGNSFEPARPAGDPQVTGTTEGIGELLLEGSVTGTHGYYHAGLEGEDRTDWWRVTVPRQGTLTMHPEVLGEGQFNAFGLYDENERQLDRDGVRRSAYERSMPLDEGTYYIQLHGGTGAYSYAFRTRFTPSALEPDPLGTHVREHAAELPLAGVAPGTLGYYHPELEDMDQLDWWTVTVPREGTLHLHAEAVEDGGQFSSIEVYDPDQRIDRDGVARSAYQRSLPLAAGTYHLQLARRSGAFSYHFRTRFEPSTLPADPLDTHAREHAVELPLEGTATGTLGYYYPELGEEDATDWWTITVPREGTLRLHAEIVDEGGNFNAYELYDPKRQVDRDGVARNSYERVHHLAAGTYHLQLTRRSGAFSYRVATEFSPSLLPADPDHTRQRDAAAPAPVGDITTGTLGYYERALGSRDDTDWWRLEVPRGGELIVHLVTVNGNARFQGAELITAAGDRVNRDGVPRSRYALKGAVDPGSYYLQVQSGSGAFSYVLAPILVDDGPEGPAVTGVFPPGDTTDLAADVAVAVSFNRPLDPETVHPDTVSFTDRHGVRVPGELVYEAGLALFRPTEPLARDVTYHLTVTEGLRDQAGAPLTAQKRFAYATGPALYGVPVAADPVDPTDPPAVAELTLEDALALVVSEADQAALLVLIEEGMRAGRFDDAFRQRLIRILSEDW